MRITIHQPEHIPWLGVMYKLTRVEYLVILDNVQFRKNYFGNRNRVMGPQGPTYVTVPVHLSGHTSNTYRDIQIVQDNKWRKRYLGILRDGYRKHPFFQDYFSAMQEILDRPWTHVAALNEEIIRFLCRSLDLSIPMVRASEMDLPKSRSTELLLHICRKVGATEYLAGSQAGNYLQEDLFEAEGVKVLHTDFVHPTYPQQGTREFVSHLGSLDLLMNCGPQASRIVRACGASSNEK
ncbi:MAG: WbqC family protein [Candidatus Xenobium sp.]|jgi:hypothetical protein|nr:WbqC family protein [Burkholderiales bacterium]